MACRAVEYNDFGEPTATTQPSSTTTGDSPGSTTSDPTTAETTDADPSGEPTTATPTVTSSDADTSSGADTSTSGDTGTTGGDAAVVLNELSSSDDDPIELYNFGERPIDLSGYILTDDLAAPYDPEADLEEYVFPEGTMLGAGEFLVVLGGAGPDLHFFGLSGNGDYVTLFDVDLVVVDFVEYESGDAEVSYCRVPDGGEWVAGCAATFAASNSSE